MKLAAMAALAIHLPVNKCHRISVRLVDRCRIAAREPVFSSGNAGKFKFYPMAFELPGHPFRLFVGDIGIVGAMDQHRGGVMAVHVLDGHVGIELPRLPGWIPATHLQGPAAGLPTELVKSTAIALPVS